MSIEAIASAVPSIKHSAKDIAEQTGADETFIKEKIGIEQRFILGADETGLDLAEQAVKKLLDETGVKPEQVGSLVYITQNPDRRLPHNAPALAQRVGLPNSLASFDLSLGCSGYVYGLATIEAFMIAQGIEYGILVTCDPYSRIMASEDKATNAVFGDAATASLISLGGRTKLYGCDFGTDGSGGDAIRVEAGGSSNPSLSFDENDGVPAYEREQFRLHMEGRDVFNFVNSQIPLSISRCLEKAKLEMDEIDWFGLHQGSAYMLNSLARRCRIPQEKLLMNINRYGNTVSSTIPLLLQDLEKNGHSKDQKVLISGFGVGLSWATGILEFSK